MRIRSTLTTIVAVLLLLSGREASAGFLSGLDATAFISAATLDQDLILPTLASTRTTGAVDFFQTTTSSGWSSNVAGPYFGSDLNVNYAGDSSAYNSASGGPITWSSGGFYGTQAWTGSGTATFTSTDLGNVTGTYQSTLTIGSNTIVFDSTISGSEDASGNLTLGLDGESMATIGSSPPVVLGTLLVVEHNPAASVYYSKLWARNVAPGTTFYYINGKDTMVPPHPVVGPKWHITFQATTVPEPASLTLFVIAAPCLYGASVVRRRRGGRSS